MGESIQFPKPESEIRFGWGISYNYIGQMHQNLNKYDVVVGLEIPDFRVIPYYKPFSRDPKYCHKWNTGIKTKLLFETCQKIWPAYIGTIAKLDDSQERIRHIMEKEIPAVVPDFKLRPVPTETTNGQPNAKRVKRFITDLLSLGIQGFSAFYQNRKQNKLKKGMEKLFERQDKLNNRVTKLDNDMISLAKTTLLSLDHFQSELVRQGEHIKHLTNRVKHVEMAMQHHEHQITDNRNSIQCLGNMLGVLLSDLHRYLLLYESILSECQCSLSAGSWYLEANIAYCAEDPDNPSTQLKLYYTVNMATVIYQFQEKLKTEGITDLTLFTEQIPFDAKEPDLIVEEDSYVLEDTSPVVNYKEVMEDFAMRHYLPKPDLAMSMAEPSHWFGGHNSWLTFVGVAAVLVVVLIPFLLFTLYKYCGIQISVSENQFYFGKITDCKQNC